MLNNSEPTPNNEGKQAKTGLNIKINADTFRNFQSSQKAHRIFTWLEIATNFTTVHKKAEKGIRETGTIGANDSMSS